MTNNWMAPFLMVRDALKADLEAGRVVRLLPGHDVFLWVFAGDGDRFAWAFRETWKRLPLWVRRALLRYWAGPDPERPIVSPRIELNRLLCWGDGCPAFVDRCGHRLRFDAKNVDEMPDEVLQAVIAHELAIVVQHELDGLREDERLIIGRRSFFEDENGDWVQEFIIDAVADDMISEWGFDRESKDRRPVVAGRSKVIESDDSPRLVSTNSMEVDQAAELS
jgi:hypothetical protein